MSPLESKKHPTKTSKEKWKYRAGRLNRRKLLVLTQFACLALIAVYLSFLAFQAQIFEPDEISHYSLNRSIPFKPSLLANPWGKPLFVLISYALILATNDAGLIVVRLLNISISMCICYVTCRICRKLNFSSLLVLLSIPLLFTSPLFAKISISALTEPLFCFLIMLALFLFYDGRTRLSAISISLSCLARQEGFILLPIWWVFTWEDKRAVALTALFPLLWGISLIAFGYSPLYMVMMYPSVLNPLVVQWEDTSMLGQGFSSLSYYLIKSPMILGYTILFLSVAGFLHDLKNRQYAILRVTLVSYILFHSLILVFPYFGSVGFVREIYPIIPVAVILATSILEQGRRTISARKPKIGKKIDALLVVLIVSICIINLAQTTTSPYDRAVILGTSQSYNELQHKVGRFLAANYPRNVKVFCPSSMFILQSYLTLPTLYWHKNQPGDSNNSVLELDGDFPIHSYSIYRDCPSSALVIWSSDFPESDFFPNRIDSTQYIQRYDLSDGIHRIVVYERR